ncbi:Uncharacterized conserved protein YgiB, involved in bioifilm formation, UPF0441/DUF1190 family [Palleronia marisminoris]|uniref:DUF1190 domain-containing protein n=1 Tax=Palleronia marisminoris TaxID=315423 RepID=A0A1Y5SBQ9_9RHOB|nr:DUF1190 domain-containing protein [Palleronia marisminoris]SFG70620.1 Uncharacterized conserved protein YgiB, involved in bioifilm formation, UPF0441/DUF1190 family [Palleronia marisminoris]SLN35986.1 hypothetical protein PAM7066_01529 [Palleronia marisminoris]
MTQIRPRKRARATRLVLLGSAAFGLAACQEEQVEATVFPSVEECRALADLPENDFTAEECAQGFDEAQAIHAESAPRYEDQALCEEQHGGECVAEQSAGGGSIFLPLLAGYMIGNMLGGRGMAAQPLYRTGGGRYATPSGGTSVSGLRGTTQVRPASFAASPSTRTAAPLTRSTVNSRGGFGASRTGGGFGSRSFGG